jgi:hypothetical protein
MATFQYVWRRLREISPNVTFILKRREYISWETHDNPTIRNTTYVDIKEVVLAKEWNSFHISEKKLDYLHLKHFLKYECELYSSNH